MWDRVVARTLSDEIQIVLKQLLKRYEIVEFFSIILSIESTMRNFMILFSVEYAIKANCARQKLAATMKLSKDDMLVQICYDSSA